MIYSLLFIQDDSDNPSQPICFENPLSDKIHFFYQNKPGKSIGNNPKIPETGYNFEFSNENMGFINVLKTINFFKIIF